MEQSLMKIILILALVGSLLTSLAKAHDYWEHRHHEREHEHDHWHHDYFPHYSHYPHWVWTGWQWVWVDDED